MGGPDLDEAWRVVFAISATVIVVGGAFCHPMHYRTSRLTSRGDFLSTSSRHPSQLQRRGWKPIEAPEPPLARRIASGGMAIKQVQFVPFDAAQTERPLALMNTREQAKFRESSTIVCSVSDALGW